MVQEISTEAELNSLISSGPVIVDFYAVWCGPCKAIAPVYERFENEYDTLKFAKVNVDENSDLVAKYEVTAFPTFIIIKGGKVVDERKGATEHTLREFIEKNI